MGRTLAELASDDVRITTVVRRRERLVDPPGNLQIEQGDTLVLSGTLDRLAAAESRLLRAA